MLRCLLPATGCMLDVTFALRNAASPENAPLLSVLLLTITAASAIPLLLRISRVVVGEHLPEATGSSARRT
jgi:hypothetical protein